MRFRVTVFGQPKAPWRETYDQALADAKRLKLASYDSVQREWFVPVPADIERDHAR